MRLSALFVLFTFCIQFFSPAFADGPSVESGSSLEIPQATSSSGTVLDVSSGAMVLPGNGSGLLLHDEQSGISSSSSVTSAPLPAIPVSPLHVRINEVMWMGSDLSTADEWIELTAVPALSGAVITEPASLEGWSIVSVKDTGIETVIARFTSLHRIASGGYIVIANYPASQSRLRREPDLVSSAMSIPNTKLLLRLRDAAGVLMDEVDDGIVAPFAGSNPSGGIKASMERLNPRLLGAMLSNWVSANTRRGWDSDTTPLGTPGYENRTIDPPDMQAPAEATDIRAYMFSGSVLMSWKQSTSLDVYMQYLDIQDAFGNQLLQHSLSADVNQLVLSASGAARIVHRSSDDSGHVSTGVTISVQPLYKPIIEEILPDPVGSDTNEWIELSNNYNVPLDLRGWALQSGSKSYSFAYATGSILLPGEHRVLSALQTGLTLPNTGGEVRLSFLAQAIDTLAYPGLPEGISFARNIIDNNPRPQCVPRPGFPNDHHAIGVEIDGIVSGTATLNLTARAVTGSLVGAACHWDYGDGYVSESCNPPVHTMKTAGDRIITLTVKDYCSNTVVHTRSFFVLQKAYLETKTATKASCAPSSFSGVVITEFLAAPGDEEDEWIEIHNPGEGEMPLCGWSIDDREGSSKPFRLDHVQLKPHEYFIIATDDSKIALNNDQDIVRLIAPLPSGGTGVHMSVAYQHAKTGQSHALRDDNQWLDTLYPTPGSPNRFTEVDMHQSTPTVVLNALLPNPHGTDADNEWIELQNLTARPQWLNGWSIRSASGNTLSLDGLVLAKNELKRIALSKNYTLGNTSDSVSLIDDTDQIRSVLAWRKPKNGEIIHRFIGPEPIYPTTLTVIDPHTIRASFMSEVLDAPVRLTTGLAGIRSVSNSYTKEIKNTLSALMVDKKIELKNDTIGNIFYAYADGVELAPLLLQMGYAYVPADYDFERRWEYIVYEQEARKNMRGIWSTEDSAIATEQHRTDEALDARVKKDGLILTLKPAGGLVSSGQIVTLSSNAPADFFVQIGTGEYLHHSGSLVIQSDMTLHAYAEYGFRTVSGSLIRSSVATQEYTALRDRYDPCIRISEIYPSPLSGEQEWVELENICDEVVNLLGWGIDDIYGAGSKKQVFDKGVRIPPFERYILSGSLLAIALNNTGDTVSIYMPNDRVSDSVRYPLMKKGQSYALLDGSYCKTDELTIDASNACITKKAAKKSTKSVKTKLEMIGLKTLFQFLIADNSNMNTKNDHEFQLYEGLEGKNENNKIWTYVIVFVIATIALLILVFRRK